MMLALLNQSVLSATFGAAASLDALFAAASLPAVFAGVVSAANHALLIPALAAAHQNRDKTAAGAVALTNLILIGTILIALYLALSLTRGLYVPLLFPGFDDLQRQLTISLVPIMGASLVLSGISGCLQSIMTYHRRFLLPPVTGYFLAVLPMLFALGGGIAAGIGFVAWGYLTGEACRLLVLAYGARGMVGTHLDRETWTSARRLVRPLVALLGTNLAYSSTIVIEKTLASTLAPGSVTVLYLAQRIAESTASLSTTGVATVAYPEMARLGTQQDAGNTRMAEYLDRVLSAVHVYSAFLAAGAIVFGSDIFRVLFGHGKMTDSAIHVGGQTLAASAGLLLLATAGTLLVRSMYSQQRRTVPNIMNVTYLAVFAASGLALSRLIGTPGIAAAASCGFLVNYTTAALVYRHRHRADPTALFLRPLLYCLLAVLCLWAGRWMATRLDLGPLPLVVLGATVGCAMYSALLLSVKDRGITALLAWRRPV